MLVFPLKQLRLMRLIADGPASPWDADETQLSVPMRRLLGGADVPSGEDAGAVIHAEPAALADVRLANGTHEWIAQDTNTRFLLRTQLDSLLYNTRVFSGIKSPPGPAMGGWEAPGAPGRGSFEGHWLSAASRAAVTVPSEELKGRVLAFVAEVRRIQRSTPAGPYAGFVGGMDPRGIDDLFAISSSVPTVNASIAQAPLYHIHKWLAGLLDVHLFLEDQTALDVAIGLFDWLEPKMRGLIERHSMSWWDDILQWEYVSHEHVVRSANALVVVSSSCCWTVAGRVA